MKHKIAIVPYLNMLPLQMSEAPRGCELYLLDPRSTVEAVASGEIAAAVVPVGGLPAIQELVHPLGPWGITADGVVGSVLFFSKRPFNSYRPEHRIAVTEETATSVKLLALLLGYANGFDQLPQIADAGDEPDGELLIGDRALHRLHQSSAPYVVDLAGAWQQQHQLPFVFARWVINRDAPDSLRESILQWLADCDQKRRQLIEAALSDGARQSMMSPAAVRAYLQKIEYRVGVRHQQGQRLFESETARYLRNPPFPFAAPEKVLGGEQ